MHIRATRLISGPPDRTLELATDFLAWDRLLKSIIELRLLDPDPPSVGSRVLAVRKIGPLTSRQVFMLSEVSESGIVLHTEGPGPARVVLSLMAVPEAENSRVVVDLSGHITGLIGFLTPLFRRRLASEWDGFLDQLTAAVATPSL